MTHNTREEHSERIKLAKTLNKIISNLNRGGGVIASCIETLATYHDSEGNINPTVLEGLEEIIHQYRNYMRSDNDTDIADARSALDQWCKKVRDHLIDHKLYGQTNSLKR